MSSGSWNTLMTATITGVSASTIIRIVCQDGGHTGGFMGQVTYSGQQYYTKNPISSSLWTVTAASAGGIAITMYSLKDAHPWGGTSTLINSNAYWVWNNNGGNSMTFDLKMSDIILAPTPQPTPKPTPKPTKPPSAAPTDRPTPKPTPKPTKPPSAAPTDQPTSKPTSIPTLQPTKAPSRHPTGSPTTHPTQRPTSYPTDAPTLSPSPSPTNLPTPTNTYDCGQTVSGSYVAQPVQFVVNLPYPDVALQIDATQSTFNLVQIDAYLAFGNHHFGRDTDGVLALNNMPVGNYKFVVLGDDVANGEYVIQIRCASKSPTPAPTTYPTPSPTIDPTASPTAGPSAAPSDSPVVSPTAAPTVPPTKDASGAVYEATTTAEYTASGNANQIDADDAAADYIMGLIKELEFVLAAVGGVVVLGCCVCGVWCLFRMKSQKKILEMQVLKINEGRNQINEDTAHGVDTADTNQQGEGGQSGAAGETNMIIPMFVSPPPVKSVDARNDRGLVGNSGQPDAYVFQTPASPPSVDVETGPMYPPPQRNEINNQMNNEDYEYYYDDETDDDTAEELFDEG
eukprot:85593_1